MKYAGFSRASRLIYVEEYAEFFNNVGSYLQLNSSARHLNIEIIEDNIPNNFYNYKVQNRKLVLHNEIDEEHIQAVESLATELKIVKNLVRKANRPYLEIYGSTGISQHLINRMHSISEKILQDETLTESELALFEYQKSKFDNVSDMTMARMIVTQHAGWQSQLDTSLLTLLKNIDSQTSSGY